jgi:3-hydroxyisobutyrate dehydrogenase-like beta-hydroxyacid dehydrogenase
MAIAQETAMDIGFIGIGQMGRGMVRSLLRSGHHVTVYNRTRDKAASLEADGAKLAERPADACRADFVVTMLADDAAVEAVTFGETGILSALAPGAVHVGSSTISVACSERLAAAHEKAGRHYVAAPVFGRPEAAETGKLFVIAGGSAALIKRCQALFDAVGQRTFVVGERPSQANLVKLAGNFLFAATIESLGEAMALVRKGGIDSGRFLDLLTNSVFTAPVYRTYGGIIVSEKYEPAAFPVTLGLKDIRLALAAADAAAVPMPIASLIRDHFLEAVAQGHGDSDWASLARVVARNAGL